jgi:hypothetical protein
MYKLYSRLEDHETIFETWGASTKHPDARFYFSDFNKCDWFDEKDQIIPWLFECASKMSFPYHAIEIAQYALEFVE